jgi:hypothetical protein
MIGRYCELNNIEEIKDLKVGMDFRKPEYRREVFLRFYEFHLKYKSHPGGIYFAFPYLSKKFNLDIEQNLWIAYINGCTQNIVSTWLIFQQFPTVKNLDIDKLDQWWNKEYIKYKVGSGWDLDRRYFKIGKTGFPNCVKSYKKCIDQYGSQLEFYNSLTTSNDKFKNYEKCWEYIRKNFLSFGRLSAFSYLEYLRIQGINVDCNNLYFEDISGSRSHRNGVCKILGRDDLDWWKKKIHYDKETIEWIKLEAEKIFNEAKARIKHEDVSYFTFESTLCNYKSWHRPKRRYPNVYMDMMYNRIKYAESQHGNKFDIFWQMRKDCLPKELRYEDNPKDAGVTEMKQDHYRNTGQVIMMNKEWDCFKNNYNDYVA